MVKHKKLSVVSLVKSFIKKNKHLCGIVAVAVVIVITYSVYTSAAATSLFSDNFDSGDMGWTNFQFSVSPNHSTTKPNLKTGDNHGFTVGATSKGAFFNGSNSSGHRDGFQRDVSTHGFASLILSYSRATAGLSGGDQFVVQYAFDAGDFTTLETLTTNQVHTTTSFTIPNPDRHSKLTIRFYLIEDDTGDKAGLDNIQVNGDNAALFYDGFEAGTNNTDFTPGGWTKFETPRRSTSNIWTDNNNDSSGHSALVDGSNGDDPDDALVKAFDTTGYQNIKVRYARMTNGFSNNDTSRFKSRYSTDSGSHWTDMESPIGSNQSYTTVLFALPSTANNNPNFQIRFEMDGLNSSRNGYVDDVIIWGDVIPPSTTLIINKVCVPNSDTGKFNLKIDGSTTENGANAPCGGTTGAVVVNTGTHTISETAGTGTNLSDYTVVIGGDCAADGSVTLSAGNNKTCTITNTKRGSITVHKNVLAPDGNDVSDTHSFSVTLNSGNTNPVSEASSYTYSNLTPGNYSIGENVDANYDFMNFSQDTDPETSGAQITIAPGQNVDLTITNKQKQGSLVVKKVVTNPNGGTAVASNFSFKLNSGDPVKFIGDSLLGENDLNVNPGSYTITETPPSGAYAISYNNCGNITVASNGPSSTSTTCTITNSDIPSGQGAITVVKKVINDNGGTLNSSSFSLKLTPEESNPVTVTSGQANFLALGTYTVSEIDPSPLGYAQTGINCVNGATVTNGIITLDEQQAWVCTVTNNDKTPSLRLIKQMNLTHGGTATASNFILKAQGNNDTTLQGSGPTVSSKNLHAGTYTLSESANSETDVDGYMASDWSCVKNNGEPVSGNTVTLGLGDSATCTIINSDKQAHVTIIKKTNGGNGSFNFTVAGTGNSEFSQSVSLATREGSATSESVLLNTGNYNVTETVPNGWTLSSVACIYDNESIGNAIINGETISVDSGDGVTCTFTNTIIPPSPTPTPTPTPTQGGGGNGGPVNGGGTTPTPTPTPTREVLGAQTTPTPSLSSSIGPTAVETTPTPSVTTGNNSNTRGSTTSTPTPSVTSSTSPRPTNGNGLLANIGGENSNSGLLATIGNFFNLGANWWWMLSLFVIILIILYYLFLSRKN